MKFNFAFIAIMATLLTLTIFSCKDDDAETTLVGTWKINSITDANCSDPDDDFTTIADSNFEFCESLGTSTTTYCSTITIVFADAGYTITGVTTTTTTTTIDGQAPVAETDTTIGTYTVDGNQITMCETGVDCETLTFTLSGNTVTLSGNNGDCDTTLVGVK